MPLLSLRPYQTEPGRAIIDSVRKRRGLTFSVEMARQMGKNELSAQIEVLLLTAHAAAGGQGVKASPTFKPQTLNSILRLRERMTDAGYGPAIVSNMGYILGLGRARWLFFSAEPTANVVGATAGILLEIDEAQDVDKTKYSRDFRPMSSSTNATTVLYGTAWTEDSLLEETKQLNLELERRDGIKRHFRYDWTVGAASNPAYGRYVEAERIRLGEDHPLFQTQYLLNPLGAGGRMFSHHQLALIQGTHEGRSTPHPAGIYVAGIDVAGADEVGDPETVEELLARPRSGRDSTVLTIARVHPGDPRDPLRTTVLHIEEQIEWLNRPHHLLLPELVATLRTWRAQKTVIDATGIGHTVANFLTQALGRRVIEPFSFTSMSKSALAYGLIAAVNSGGLQLYAQDGSPEHAECTAQLRAARSAFRANQTMNFFVHPADGHDDFLMSLALVVEAGALYQPRQAVGRNS